MIGLWRDLGAPARLRFALALALSALAGLAGIVLLGLSGWFLTAAALAGMAGTGHAFNHLYPAAGVRAAAFTRVVARYGEQLVGHDATLSLSARLRPQLFAAGARSGRGVTGLPAGELSALIDDVDAAEAGFLRVVSPAAALAASIAVALGFTFAADPLTGLIALFGFGLSAGLLPWRAARAARRAACDLADELEAGRARIAHLVENATELDIIGALPREATNAADQLRRQQAALQHMERPFRGLAALSGALGAGLALMVLYRVSPHEGGLALAAGAALALIAAFEASAAGVQLLDAAPRAGAAAARLRQRLHAPPPRDEPPLEARVPLDDLFPIVAERLLARPAPDGPAIGPVDILIAPSELVLLTGPSGSGKTTLAETLMGLHPHTGGTLSYGGLPAGRLRRAQLLERIAISPQFPAFLDGTLRAQMHLAKPGAQDAAIREALAAACIDSVVKAAPAGLDTVFHDGTGGFSGGELRRLGLARALLADPQLLILDEPFAGLDAPLADRLAERLAAWARTGRRSILLIQHAPCPRPWLGLARREIALAGQVARD